jgi:Methylamine utilization protein MauJ
LEALLFAKDLEYLLAEWCQHSDVSPVDASDIATRFHSLRGCGKLPRGRENRAQRLHAGEIAAAIFGLVPVNSKWAGHAAIILGNLRPVGGVGASFHGAASLTAAVETLVTDRSLREGFFGLTLSVAERFTNSNGSATLSYQHGGVRRHAAFVSNMAVSLLQPGAEHGFEIDGLHPPMSRAVVFSRAFFHGVATAVARSIEFPMPPAGDGSEYTAEEALQARHRALGVQSHSRFLNVGVETQVTWPKQERLVQFDRYHLVLMPKTKEHAHSIHVDLRANRLTDRQALTVINRFLSVLTWCDDQFAVMQDGWSGNPVPVAVPRRNLAFAMAEDWPFDRRMPRSDEARRALALYREGRNAEETALVSYAVLSYFKIIEIRHPNGSKAKKWIAKHVAVVCASADDKPAMKEFKVACGSEAPEEYIYTACRLAVAHASIKRPSDADDIEEIRRLHSASYVLRLLARLMISEELGVSDQIYSGD